MAAQPTTLPTLSHTTTICTAHLHHHRRRQAAAATIAAEPFDLRAELATWTPYVNRAYHVAPVAQTKSVFVPAEDHLLALGMVRYGADRVDLVRSHLLPSKSAESIRARWTPS